METDLKDQIRDLIERGAQPVSFREDQRAAGGAHARHPARRGVGAA